MILFALRGSTARINIVHNNTLGIFLSSLNKLNNELIFFASKLSCHRAS